MPQDALRLRLGLENLGQPEKFIKYKCAMQMQQFAFIRIFVKKIRLWLTEHLNYR